MAKLTDGFAEFELKKSSIKMLKGEEPFELLGCVGSFEESFGTKVVQQKCEGKVVKQRTVPDGTGTLKLSLHMKWSAYIKMYGMGREELKEGVYAYGSNMHEPFAYVCEALDIDGNIKYKAYPNCVVSDGIARKVENGGEEVAEVELNIALAADEHGECMYEAPAEELTDETIKTKWMTDWNYELIKKAETKVGGMSK